MKSHWETRQLSIYELRTTKSGPKIKEGKCIGEPSPSNPCGGVSGSTRGQILGREAPIAQLALTLTGVLRRSVIDKTGLRGTYDFDLNWTPDDNLELKGPGDPDQPLPDPNGPSIFTALEEQLGLHLESTKGPVEILVIDHVERPSEN